MKNININDTEYKKNGFFINFPVKAYEGVILADKLIVSFSSDDLEKLDPHSEFWRAVWCYDKVGNILWKVESPYYIDKHTGDKIYYDCVNKDGRHIDSVSYVIYSKENDQLRAFGLMGYSLDSETGKLIEIVSQER